MASIQEQLETSRQSLLDLSTRNRLLSVPQKSKQAKIVEVVDELSTEIFRLLVKDGKALSFLPGKEKQNKKQGESDANSSQIADSDEENDYLGELPQPEDDEVDERGIAKRHTDYYLQTILTSEGLQKRLLSLYYDAITFEQEQGVNILYLAVGMLKWFEADNSDMERYAPLVLVPVSLDRGSAAEKFKIRWRNEDPATNLSLQAKMKAEFGLIIPDLPDDDDIDITAYMQKVSAAVSSYKRFEVIENKIVLGFFSFAKFLMYRDLDIENWPESERLDKHSLIAGLMQDGFPASEGMIGEDEHIDPHLPPERIFHVVDADSSQTLAIEEARRGKNLVIQGPPGTGKSQTITNIIASAVADGKKVLFVAEKMAALEVVHRRMSNIALGPLCLELHSAKSNKRTVLEELKRTRDLGRPKAHDGAATLAKVRTLQEKLNTHAVMMHQPHQPSGLSAYQIIGHAVRLKQNGIDARNVALKAPENWSAQDRKDREDLLADVAARIHEIGIPAQHVWRGVNRSQLLPNEFDRLDDQLREVKKSLLSLMSDIQKVEGLFFLPDTALKSFVMAVEALSVLERMPKADYTALGHAIWLRDPGLLKGLINDGARYRELKEKLANQVIDAAWTANLDMCRQHIAMHGTSPLRIFQSDYRQSMALFKSMLTVQMPKEHAARLAILDDILTTQRLERSIQDQCDIGRDAFGSLWQGLLSDWSALLNLLHWRESLSLDNLPEGFLPSCTKIDDIKEWGELSEQLASSVPEFMDKLSALFSGLSLNVSESFEKATSEEDIDRTVLAERLDQWASNMEAISRWINFKTRFDKLKAVGLFDIAKGLWDGSIKAEVAHGVFERSYFDALTEVIFTMHPDLRNFDGEEHHLHVANFRENDNYRIEQARVELRSKHYATMPHSDGGIGPLGVLNGEFAKKRNHLPIRQLIKRAGPAIQALKPVFMMSPLSVAQFLEPGSIQFDLLVIDEASQIEPVDALGAVARAKQIVVVGDTRQLPPTRFFSRITGNLAENDNEEDDTVATQDVESILSLCLARGLPHRMLRWHYRSRHQSLIAVSNKEFYENKLFIVPSPYDAASGMGLKFNYLPNGIFDSGGTATNQIEAKVIADAIIKHAMEHPGLSLGVGAFSTKQRQAIIDELEVLRRKHPETEPFFASAHPAEPFFVKNLENIQGDERDVIYISVGYARNQSGYMAMRFGPLSADGGERRLNVLISRAKQRCEVFSSITADDIDLERARGAGVAALKLFLKFAQTGQLDYGKITDLDSGSPFEEQVAAALRARGYDVKTQIGIAGFFIDIAIVDPERPGRFLLGIECDGASYHSSRSARDRDRLRQAVLEDHGWIIHRIWSTDWFRRPSEQLEKTLIAIEQAQNILKERDESTKKTIQSHNVFEITSDDKTLTITVGKKKLSTPYKEASLPVPAHLEPHQVPDSEMAIIVAKIVEIETPIHESEIVARVRDLWRLARAGSRIQAKVQSALNIAKRKGTVAKDLGFYYITGANIPIRDRYDVLSSGLKKPECLPPMEIRKAILSLIASNYGAEPDAIAIEVARLFGFKSTSSQLREVIEKEIRKLLNKGDLVQVDNLLNIAAQDQQAKI